MPNQTREALEALGDESPATDGAGNCTEPVVVLDASHAAIIRTLLRDALRDALSRAEAGLVHIGNHPLSPGRIAAIKHQQNKIARYREALEALEQGE